MTTRSKLVLRTAARYPSNQTKLGPAPFASFDQDGSTSTELGESSNYGVVTATTGSTTSSTKLTEIQERCHGNRNRSSATTPTTPHIAVSPASTPSTSSTSHSNSEHELFHEKLFKIESRELRSSTEELICCQGDGEQGTKNGNFLSLSPRDEMLRRASQPMLLNRRGSCSPIEDLLSNCGFRKWSLDSRPKSSLSARSHSPCKNLMLETSFCGSRPIPTKSIEAEEVVLTTAVGQESPVLSSSQQQVAAEAPPTTTTTTTTTIEVAMTTTTTASTGQQPHHNSIYMESSFLGDGMRGMSVDSCSNPFDVFRQQESISSIGSFDAAPPINTINYSVESGETSPPHSSSHWSPYNFSSRANEEGQASQQREQNTISRSHGNEDVINVAVENTQQIQSSRPEQSQQQQQPEQSNQFSISNLSSSSSSSSLSSLPSLPTTLPTSRPTTSLTPSSMRTTTNTIATAAIERPRPTATAKELDKSKLVSYIQQNHGNAIKSTTATAATRSTTDNKISIKLPHQTNSGGSVDEEDSTRATKRRVSDWGQFAERLQSPSRASQESSSGSGGRRRGSSK